MRSKTRFVKTSLVASDVPNCKFFFPCNEGSGNTLTCDVTGTVWDATSVGGLTWGTTANAVRRTTDTDISPTILTGSGFPALSTSNYWTFIAAGRVINNIYNDSNTPRIALGDNNNEVLATGYGWGIADGRFHSAVATGMSPKTQSRRDYSKYAGTNQWETVTSVDTGTDTLTVSGGHSFQNGDLATYYGPTSTIAPLVNWTPYYIINRAATTFQLSLTQGGAAINLTSVTGVDNEFYYPDSIQVFGYGYDVAIVAKIAPTGHVDITAYDMDAGTALATAANAPTGTVGTTGQTVTFSPYFRFSNYDLYGLSLHETTIALPDLSSGVLYQCAHWRNGRKILYPGWAGVT